jgi:hypothetical protein
MRSSCIACISASRWPICHGPSISLSTPIFYRMWLGIAMYYSHVRITRAGWRVAIFDQRRSFGNRAGAEVESEHRLDLHMAAEVDKLIRAELVGLDRLPGQFTPARALIARANAILSFVAAEHIAAGVAQDARRISRSASRTSRRKPRSSACGELGSKMPP